jgi:Xaa-Pro aminopeptidase
MLAPPMYARRRTRLLETMEADSAAILLGTGLRTRSNDTHFPFRQDSDFHYATGFDHPNAVAVLRKGGDPPYSLFVEPRDPAAETWTGYRPGVEGAVDDYGADQAFRIDELLTRLPTLIGGARVIYHVLGRDPKVDALLVEQNEAARIRSRTGVLPPEALRDPRIALHEMRLYKEPQELETMRRAAEISREAHAEAARLAHVGAYEYELEAVLNYTFRRRGAAGPAYDSIVGSGANATVLHYIANRDALREGDAVLIDSGCELEGYASDVTRVYPVGGAFSGPARDLYQVVLGAQKAALKTSSPGQTLDAVHHAALRGLVDGLLALGLLEGDAESAIESKSYQRYYMHRTSHWLGLDVHDVGSYVTAGAPRRLEAGMAYTVEPGLYVGKDDEQAPEAYRGIGIRIEDDIVVTKEHHENLTEAIPKEIDDLEALVKEGRR